LEVRATGREPRLPKPLGPNLELDRHLVERMEAHGLNVVSAERLLRARHRVAPRDCAQEREEWEPRTIMRSFSSVLTVR